MKKNLIYFLTLIILISISINFNSTYAAGTSSSSSNKADLYKEGKSLVYRAKKLEKKNKQEKAQKIYLKAYEKFEKAYSKDKKNPDILNYLGFTLRKTGNLEKAEFFYLEGLQLDAGHLGINEYLGELYIQTNRIELAKKRLEVLSGCDCEEYKDLKELIENN